MFFRTGQLALFGCKFGLGGSQAGETDPLIQILRRFDRMNLNSGCARLPDRLVQLQPRRDVVGEVVLVGEDDSKRRSVFNGYASTLRLVWHHWMSSVSQNASLISKPMLKHDESSN